MLQIKGISYFIFMNIVAFSLYGSDKRKARLHKWRIPEKALLGVVFVGGSVGALLGMQVFRHKTRHWKFKILVPFFSALHIALLCAYYIKFQ